MTDFRLFGRRFCAPPPPRVWAAAAVISAVSAFSPSAQAQPRTLPGGMETAQIACDPDPGGTFPWEAATPSGTNTGNGNKMTTLGLTGWSAQGGLPVSLSLFHNSQSTTVSSELGPKWTHSFDIFLIVDPQTGAATIHWGDALAYPFVVDDMTGLYQAPDGIRDVLDITQTGYTLTTKSGVVYAFSHGQGNRWKCDSITDRNGNALTLVHNTGDFVTSVSDSSGRALSFSYNGANQLVSVSDPSGKSWSFAYDAATGDLAQVVFPSSVPASGQNPLNDFTYDSSHNIVDWKDARDKHWKFKYEPDGTTLSEKNPLNITTATYKYLLGSTKITDGRGYQTEHVYQNGALTGVKNAQGLSETYGYDTNYNKASLTDRAGHTWAYTYDAKGNVLTAADPLNHTTTATYNALNQPLTVTTPSGKQTTYTYDAYGNALTVTNPMSQTTTLAYNASGQVISATDALNHTTTFGYNVYGDQTSITDATGRVMTSAYDVLGRKVSATDASGLTTTYAYDGRGLNTSITAPGNRTVSFVYDGSGHKTAQTNALNQTDTFVYDDAGQVTSHTDALSRTVSFTYDADGNKTAFVDGLNHTTTYTYDGRGLLTGITYPDNTSETYGYDNAGRAQTKTDGRGVVTTSSYDNAGRLVGTSYSGGTTGGGGGGNGGYLPPPDDGFGDEGTGGGSVAGTASVSYAYDVDNRKTSMSDGTGTTTYAYDNAGRLTGRTSSQGGVSYAYDASGRKTGQTANSATTTYAYDDAGRLMSATAPNGTTSYGYDTYGRLVTTNFANGATETKTYDNNTGDLTDIWTVGAGAATLSRQSYQYDALGRKAVETLASGATRVFGYDSAGQLTSETQNGTNGYAATYSYDAAGNRSTKSQNGATDFYTYDTANKLQSVAGTVSKAYAYDNAGNVTSVTGGGGTTNLTWDGAGRVTTITYPNSSSNSFAYNGLSQRVGKLDSGGQFAYTLADDSIDSNVLADGQASYQYGAGLVSEVRGGVSKAYHSDALGTTRAMSGAGGTTTDTLETDAFGNTISKTGNSASPFGFAGQHGYQTDADSGLMRLGYRFYDASVGRFISRDPIRAGYNWYIYCQNDPVNAVDPTGYIGLRQWLVQKIYDWAESVAKENDPAYLPNTGGTNFPNAGGGSDTGSGGGKGGFDTPDPKDSQEAHDDFFNKVNPRTEEGGLEPAPEPAPAPPPQPPFNGSRNPEAGNKPGWGIGSGGELPSGGKTGDHGWDPERPVGGPSFPALPGGGGGGGAISGDAGDPEPHPSGMGY